MSQVAEIEHTSKMGASALSDNARGVDGDTSERARGAYKEGSALVTSSPEDKRMLIELLTQSFNSILRIEELSLRNRLTEGLTMSELHTVAAIGLHDKKPAGVIAAKLEITLPALTVALNKLEAKGYVERQRSDKDRRQVLVSLTTKGRKAYRAHRGFHEKLVEEVLSRLNPHEEQVLITALGSTQDFFERTQEEVGRHTMD